MGVKKESITAVLDSDERIDIPPDKAYFIVDDHSQVFVVGNVVSEYANTLPQRPHVFLTIDARMNNDAIDDHTATKVYLYPHRDLHETFELLSGSIDFTDSFFPIADIIFDADS